MNLSFYMSEDTFNKYYGNKEMMLMTLNVNQSMGAVKKPSKSSSHISKITGMVVFLLKDIL